MPFYGVYDLTDPEGIYYPELLEWVLERHVFKARLDDEPERFRAASPTHRVHAEAPPFLVLHGERDTLVPVADARRFVAALRAVSQSPVHLRGARRRRARVRHRALGAHGPRRGGDRALPRDRSRRSTELSRRPGRSVRLPGVQIRTIREGDPWT